MGRLFNLVIWKGEVSYKDRNSGILFAEEQSMSLNESQRNLPTLKAVQMFWHMSQNLVDLDSADQPVEIWHACSRFCPISPSIRHGSLKGKCEKNRVKPFCSRSELYLYSNYVAAFMKLSKNRKFIQPKINFDFTHFSHNRWTDPV